MKQDLLDETLPRFSGGETVTLGGRGRFKMPPAETFLRQQALDWYINPYHPMLKQIDTMLPPAKPLELLHNAGQSLRKAAQAVLIDPGAMDELRTPANGCFVAGTLVHTKEGLKPIEQIQVGDWVLSRPENPEQGTETAYKRVTKTFRFENKEIVRFWWERSGNTDQCAPGDSVYVTPNHPVWLNPHGWVAMGRLHLPGKGRPGTIHRGDDEWLNKELVLADGSTGAMLDVFDLYRTDRPAIAFQEEDDWGIGGLTDFTSTPPSFGEECDYDYESWGDPVNETRDRYATTVYNIEVEDWHTYFVGKTGLWVHNTNCLEATLEVAPGKGNALGRPDHQPGWQRHFQGAEGQDLQQKAREELTAPADKVRRWFEPGVCFAKGALVHTKEGLKPIEQIQVGDWVLSKPENGGEQAYKRVLRTFAHEPQRVVALRYQKPKDKPSMTSGTLNRIIVTMNHPFWTKEEGWTAPSHMRDHQDRDFHFQDKDGDDIKFDSLKSIYLSDQPNVGWTSNRWPESMRGYGSLWDYAEHRLVAPEAYALEDISWGEHPAPYFKAPVYNLEVEDFHTYYVGEHGLWVHNQNCGGLSFELRHTSNPVTFINQVTACRMNEFNFHTHNGKS